MRFQAPSDDVDTAQLTRSQRRELHHAREQARLTLQQEYADHLARLRGQIGDHAVDLCRLQWVEDGLIVSTVNRADDLILTLRCGDHQAGYYDLILEYGNVSLTAQDANALRRLALTTITSQQHDADLGYHELDVDSDGMIVHRLLFRRYDDPADEITVRCSSLNWRTVAQPNRELPGIYPRWRSE